MRLKDLIIAALTMVFLGACGAAGAQTVTVTECENKYFSLPEYGFRCTEKSIDNRVVQQAPPIVQPIRPAIDPVSIYDRAEAASPRDMYVSCYLAAQLSNPKDNIGSGNYQAAVCKFMMLRMVGVFDGRVDAFCLKGVAGSVNPLATIASTYIDYYDTNAQFFNSERREDGGRITGYNVMIAALIDKYPCKK